MTASRPILDPRQKRNNPDWVVYVRSGSQVNVYRFADESSADAFRAEFEVSNA